MKEELAWFLCQGLAVLLVAFLLSICLRRKTSEFLHRFRCEVWLVLAIGHAGPAEMVCSSASC